MEPGQDFRVERAERPGAFDFMTALRKALGLPILWLATFLALLLLAGVPALATLGYFEGAFDRGTADWRTIKEVGATLGSESWSLSETFRYDNREGLAQLSAGTARMLAALSAIAMLLGVFAAGGWLQIVFERVEGQSFRRFCYGGARYFWRFLRVLVLVALLLALVRWLFYGGPWTALVEERILGVPAYDTGKLETLESEMQVAQIGWIRDGLAALMFALVLAWGIYTRTRLVLRDGRSAFAAGTATFWVMLRHPIQTLRPLIFLGLLQVVILVALGGWLVEHVEGRASDGPRIEHVLALLAITQIAALWRHINRGATYFAAARVSQHLVGPHKKKGDPWQTIGGPGGPQYPVGDEDDGYHVAL